MTSESPKHESVRPSIDLSDIAAAEFECSICTHRDWVRIKDISYKRVMGIVADHCHTGKGSNPAGMPEDVEAVVKFLTGGLPGIGFALKRHNLKLRLEIKCPE